MVYKYFDHQADIGIIGEGRDMNEAFQEAARAMFNIMCNLKKVEKKKSINITVKAKNAEELLVEWLNELLAQINLKNMVFSAFDVYITKRFGRYILKGAAHGEKIDRQKHELKTEVKAATYSQLGVVKTDDHYRCQCIIDV